MTYSTAMDLVESKPPASIPQPTSHETQPHAMPCTPSSTPEPRHSPAPSIEDNVSAATTSQRDVSDHVEVAPRSRSPAPEESDLRRVPNLESLSDKQEMKYIGKLVGPVKITSSEEDERIRANSNIRPDEVFRTFHEESKTASVYMADGNQPKHRQAEGFKIDPKYAFQPLWLPDLRRDLTLNRVDRHLNWPMVEDPSSYVSTFNAEYWATKRARFHANESAKIAHRSSIAAITTKSLAAATVQAIYKTTWMRHTRRGKGNPILKEEIYKTYLPVKIPVWIRQTAVPSDGSAITLKQLKASEAELWVSITELRRSDLRLVSKKTDLFASIMEKGHDYEWLCLGGILKTHVTRVMPFDGFKLHSEVESSIVWSKKSPAHYIYDRAIQQWRLDSRLYALAVFRDWKAAAARLKARKAKAELKAKEEEEAQKKQEAEQRIVGQHAAIKPSKPKTGSLWKIANKTTRKTIGKPSRGKRKLNDAEDSGEEKCIRAPKVVRTEAEIWDLLIATAQKDVKPIEELRRKRAGSAHL